MWKQLVASYFTYSKKERTGIAVLVCFIVLFVFLPFCYPYFIKTKTYDNTLFQQEIAALKILREDSSEQFPARTHSNKYKDYANKIKDPNYSDAFKGELFYFDPNTASSAEWKRLGLREKTIATIQKYMSKGGKFYKPADITKIWGIHPREAERLIPFVQIKTMVSNYTPYEKKTSEKPAFVPVTVDINNSDSSAWIALPGIGSKLSQRILNFREKLGGFYSINQVAETFGLQDSTFQQIRPKLRLNSNSIRQININTATLEELKIHPYLRYALGNAIVQYRMQHGNYTTVADIKKIMTITEDVFDKVSPYLKVQ